jgi:lon-related putative ATP-dependent protease
MKNRLKEELPPENLRNVCDINIFSFNTTEEVPPLEGIIDQHRAINAIKFGLGIKSSGYNIYVAGLTGTGKTSIIKSFLEKIEEKGNTPDDWCYLYNFKDADTPIVVSLPAGMGKVLKRDMDELIDNLKIEIPQAFQSKDYGEKINRFTLESQKMEQKLFAEIEKEAKESGFVIKGTKMGLMFFPVVNGKTIDDNEYEKLEADKKRDIERKRIELEPKIKEFFRNVRMIELERKKKIEEINKKIGLFVVGNRIDDLREKYRNFPKILSYIDDVKENILKNISDFLPPESEHTLTSQDQPPKGFIEYKVNVVVDNSETKEVPIVIEPNPTFYNLFGRIERKALFGTLITDFTMIKAGTLLRANGGYLVVNAIDILRNIGVWEGLKRCIKNKEIRIEDLGEQYGLIPTIGLRPQPIPLNIKIIMIGSPEIYHLLYIFDEDFRKIFKVKADFNYIMDRTKEHIMDYASFISSRCKEEGIKHFDREGVAKVVEYGSRVVEDQDKLFTRFSDIADIIREAGYWADKDDSKYVTGRHVDKAIKEKIYRSNLIEERIREMIEKGMILIDTKDMVIGQVNGLSIYDLGDIRFGKPSRITARTFMGKSGVINIEREAKLSGKTHDKGILILSGYLGGKYAKDKPLTLSVSLCFEQSYGEVEGDSASAAELYALLSSISEIPVKQGIAITGSINQHGDIQPIGGVNEKIEGFFEICKIKGLTGEEGVIIPYQNTKNLMLKEEVIKAVREGAFHIYPIKHVDDGIEILTGVNAGIKMDDGSYEKDSFNYIVDKRLKELADGLDKYKDGKEK